VTVVASWTDWFCRLVATLPWYQSQPSLVEYVFFYEEGHRAQTMATRAAQALAEATGSLALDDDGFPWDQRA
jgi:hypothetical protein